MKFSVYGLAPKRSLALIFWSLTSVFLLAGLSRAHAQVYYSNGDASPDDLTFTELKDILKAKQYSKISDLLAHIRKTKPKYMKQYTLGFASKSIQESSLMNPRAIVYGRAADFVITFNGHPKQRGYEMLEVMNFNRAQKKFEFFEIEFNEKGQLGAEPYKISDDGGPQKKCLACHTGSRPIWNRYDIWPGFYGSADDFPFTLANKTGGGTIFDRLPMPIVKEQFDKFMNEGITVGRYRNLVPPSDESLGEKLERPNSNLNLALSPLNMLRVGRLLKDANASGPARYALLYGLYCERAHEEDPDFQNSFFGKIHSDFSKRAQEEVSLYHKQILIEHMKETGLTVDFLKKNIAERNKNFIVADRVPVPKATTPGEFLEEALRTKAIFALGLAPMYTLLMSVVEKFLPEAQVSTWPMQQREGVHRYDTGDSDVGVFSTVMMAAFGQNPSPEDKALIEKIQAARKSLGFRTIHDPIKNALSAPCAELAQKAESELMTIKNIDHRTPTKHPITKCVSCHTTGVAPNIEFQNPNRFIEQLKSPTRNLSKEICRRISLPPTHKDAMPPRGSTPEEKRQILEFLSTFYKCQN